MRIFAATLLFCLIAFPARPDITDDHAVAALVMLAPPPIQPVYSEPLLPVDAPTGFGWHVGAPKPSTVPVPRRAPERILLAEAQRSVGKGARDLGVRRTLWCADAINKWLGRVGINGTGSALARSFARWGEASAPQPGAIGVKHRGRRGGHVVVVKAVKGNTLIAISPNSRGKVREMKYSVRQFYAFRRPA